MQEEISIPTESFEVSSKRRIMGSEMCRQVLIGVVCNLLIIDSGFQEGWSTPTVPKFISEEDPLRMSSDQIAWVVNLLYVGVGIGSIIPFFLMNRIGRKKTLLLAALPKIISWIIIGVAADQASIFCGRILAGIGCGISYSVLPMYLGEISSKRTRGLLGTMLAVNMNIGMLLIFTIGLWISRFTMSMIAMTIPILFVVMFSWLPESSVFLTQRNRLTSAERALRWALGKDNVEEELEEIKRILITEDTSRKWTFFDIFKEMFKRKENNRAFGIIFILYSALTLTGGAPILAYQSEIFEKANFVVSTNLTIIAIGCAMVFAGLSCILLIQVTGKRTLLLISAPVCFLALLSLTLFFTFQWYGYEVSRFNWVPSVFVMIFVLSYGLALNPMPLAYLGEIFPFEMKRAAGIVTSLYYAGATTVVVKFYQVTQDLYGTHVPMWIFTMITMILWILIYFFVPETEGKTVEEILLNLKNKK
ncbi:hypothetical protein M0802_005241 [Mischocyttarus mexicanus]|nr:hypothetical protein M0802_005241 [Mischocyttarus mexicanus]